MRDTTIEMRKVIFAIILPFAFSAPALSENSEPGPSWRNLGPGGGGWIQSICASPHDRDELFVGCDVGGFYHSIDGGLTYQISNEGMEDYWVECIVPHPTDPDTIYLGNQGGVYKSVDHGKSWRWLREGFPPVSDSRWTAPIGALVIDRKNPDTLYAGIGRPRVREFGKGEIYKTTDGGESWAVINKPGSLPEDARINDLAIHPENSDHLFMSCQYGFYQSRDGGVNWKTTVAGLPHSHARRIAICRSQPDVIYLTLHAEAFKEPWQGGVYKSTDGGNHWQPCLEGLAQRVSKPGESRHKTFNYDQIVVHPDNPGIAYVGGDGWGNSKIYKTSDGGASWQNITNIVDRGWITFNGPSVKCLSMSPLDPDVIYWGSSMHVFKTTDGGTTWNQRYGELLEDGRIRGSGLEVTCLLDVFVHPADPKCLYFGYADIGLLVSEDGGETFRRGVEGIRNGINQGPMSMAFDPDDPNRCWAGFGWGSTLGKVGVVAESTDKGHSWKEIGTPETGLPSELHPSLLLDRSSPPSARRLMTVAVGHGVFTSVDSGQSWKASNEGITDPARIQQLIGHPEDSQIYWSVTGDVPVEIYRSDDGARSWKKISEDFRAGQVRAFEVAASDPNRMYLATRRDYVKGLGSFPGGIYRSNDGGVIWQQVLDDRFADDVAIDPRDADVVYAGLSDHPYHDQSTGRGIVVSRDGGKNWISLNGQGLSCKQISSITIDPHSPDRLYLGTGGNGVFVGEAKGSMSTKANSRQ